MVYKAVLFDFDGTLADSFTAITSSTNHVRQSYGLPTITEEVVREYVGLGLPNLIENLVPGAPKSEAVERYREHHAQIMLTETKLMPGVRETLPLLQSRGYKMAICSNKTVSFTKQLVKVLDLTPFFADVLGPEDAVEPKPHPSMLQVGMQRLGVSREQSLYIGDMAIDVHTARAAGMTVWLVPGGAKGRESAEGAGPDRQLHGIAELAEILT